jgi:LysM repeat protein
MTMFRRPFLAVIIISLLLTSCRSTKPVVSTSRPVNGSAKAYIDNYKDLAVAEMRRTGVPASITLAQGMLESGLGKSSLATEANNHFGIKCHNDWKGPTVKHNDDKRNECFRKYNNPAESYRDHSDFLKNTPRYRFLFDLQTTDYIGWAKGLKKAGYATNPDYANLLIAKIEQYGLNDFDKPPKSNSAPNGIKAAPAVSKKAVDTTNTAAANLMNTEKALTSPAPGRVRENNRIQYIVVKEGDTKASLEKDLDLLNWEIQRYNELEKGFTLTPGQIIYLQPKRDKAEPGKEFHIAREGESMYLISQIYGIKLNMLYQMNRMEPGTMPSPGQKIWLRSIKPVN